MHEIPRDEDRLAGQLAELHERIIGELPANEPSVEEPEPALGDSARLMHLIRMLKHLTPIDTDRVDGSTKSKLVATTADDEPGWATREPILSTAAEGVPGPAAHAITAHALDEIPRMAGRFRIDEPIGHGGFGIVFRGFDPYLKRPVAIKIPRLESMLDEHARARFVTEAKAAAALSHPRIVTVFESGECGAVCYIACEFVVGSTLAEWLSRQVVPPSPDASLRLMLTLADAIQHAHSRGVVHRDLKPANVLLEGAAEVLDSQSLASVAKISDFGLAKFTREDVTQTRSGSLIGTPAYMSPEQVRSDRDAIGAGSDVFSLGVLCYEMLTLKNPFVRENLLDTMAAIQDFEPLVPGRLNTSVSRDLDAVVMKCLEKKIANRYASAADFGRELERCLAREPVLARRITPASRAVRWIDRNRLASALMITLVAGMVGTSFGLLKSRRAESNARESAAEAQVEAETAIQVSDFLQDMFQTSDMLGGRPGEQRGLEITAFEMLQQGAEKIRAELQDQPRVQARLMATIGSVLVRHGKYEEAESLLQDSMELRKKILSPVDPELAHGHRHLGRMYMLQSKPELAETELRRAIAILELDEAKNNAELAKTLNDLGRLFNQTNPDAAMECYLRAREVAIAYKSDANEVWALDANIAAIDARAGRYQVAKERFERALQMGKAFYGTDNHPSFGAILGNLAYVHRHLGNYHRARDLQEQDLALIEQQLGKQHPSVGNAMNELAAICQRLGDYESAAEFGQRAIDVTQASLPPGNELIGIAISTHAVTRLRQRDYTAARELIKKAIDRLENRSDPDSVSQRLRRQLVLAVIERQDGNAERALEIFDEVLADPVVEENFATELNARYARAMTLAQLGNEQADAAFRTALDFADQKLSPEDSDREFFIARYHSLVGDTEAALDALDEAVAKGFRDAILLTDPDLDSLRDHPRYATVAAIIEQALRR